LRSIQKEREQMHVKKKLIVVISFISCKTSIMHAIDDEQEELRVDEKMATYSYNLSM